MITFVGHFLFYYPQGHFMVYKGQDSTTQLLWVLYASLSYPSWIVLGRQNLRLIQQAASNGIIIIAEIYHFLSDSSVLIEFFDTLLLVATHLSNLVIKEYSVEVYEWSGTTWEPYVADDVQVQFYMMSPYVLKTLSTDGKVLLNFLLAILFISSLINTSPKFTGLYFLSGPLFHII